jgi:hypothetical protein
MSVIHYWVDIMSVCGVKHNAARYRSIFKPDPGLRRVSEGVHAKENLPAASCPGTVTTVATVSPEAEVDAVTGEVDIRKRHIAGPFEAPENLVGRNENSGL